SGGVDYDVDYISKSESMSSTSPTYAAVTARSYHSGLVQVALMDGSARSISSNVDLIVWRALGSRDGREVFQMP
ncbi:MAG TPA: H-X9-DG-CTERM domain-containing protein, partial [Pirellulaceae bacterium]|nr:H-X9-DG-CTERM domain-containing protein [Pirellulaceae bacterium]